MNPTVSARSTQRRTGARAGQATASKNLGTPQPSYFNQSLIDMHEASQLWQRCVLAIESNLARGQVPAQLFKVNNSQAELSVLVGGRGRPDRFWLRTLPSNDLVLTGNRHGLLPMDGESLHG